VHVQYNNKSQNNVTQNGHSFIISATIKSHVSTTYNNYNFGIYVKVRKI